MGDNRTEALAQMRSKYEDMVRMENAPLEPDPESHWRRLQCTWHASVTFWSLYAEERERTSTPRALRNLRLMLNDAVLAVVLICPVNGDLRGAKEDALIDSLLLKPDAKPTAYMAEILAQGHPHELARVNYFRQHAGRG